MSRWEFLFVFVIFTVVVVITLNTRAFLHSIAFIFFLLKKSVKKILSFFFLHLNLNMRKLIFYSNNQERLASLPIYINKQVLNKTTIFADTNTLLIKVNWTKQVWRTMNSFCNKMHLKSAEQQFFLYNK